MDSTAARRGWITADAPRLDGKTAIVTGSTGGLGYQAALALARHGAVTVLAARNPAKGAEAVAAIQQAVPGAAVRFEHLDLASLASVARFAAEQTDAAQSGRIAILINNGAVMGLPTRERTEDGFEQQVGVNYLAHFALTLRLRPALEGGRVVMVASLAHRRARLGLNDFLSERSYSPMGAYGRSKLAMLVFALELQRVADRLGWGLTSLAAHPGWSRTNIVPNGLGSGGASLKATIAEAGFNLVAQPAGEGALPILFAAMAPEARGGSYYGPIRWGETRGAPGPARIFPQASDPQAGPELWSLSERLTGVSGR